MSPAIPVIMSYAYSFGAPSDAWNQKSLNSPLPCKDGIGCQFPKCCVGVHPGEEGTGRKYFPARTTVDRVTGEKKMQPPCVRLVGKNKEDIPGFYRRRSKKMSWPQWCAAEGISLPQPSASPLQKGEEEMSKIGRASCRERVSSPV